MNKFVKAVVFLSFLVINLVAHAPRQGLFKAFAAYKMRQQFNQIDKGEAQFEMRKGGDLSKVYMVNGVKEFKQLVSNNPFPVVVKVHAAISNNVEAVKEKFQAIADSCSKDTIFVSVDIMNKVDEKSENQQIIGTFMAQAGIFNVQLPIFLFFNHGNLAQPISVLQGEESLGRMEKAIQMNFNPHQMVQKVACEGR